MQLFSECRQGTSIPHLLTCRLSHAVVGRPSGYEDPRPVAPDINMQAMPQRRADFGPLVARYIAFALPRCSDGAGGTCRLDTRGWNNAAERMARYLITGGAGYVGSHLVRALRGRGDHCIVLDNLSTGHRAAVPDGIDLIEADLADQAAVDALLAAGPWDGVFHFAALSLVGDSMRDPMRYFAANVGNSSVLINACIRHQVRKLVFSSTAALFGLPERLPIAEDDRIDPGSPYGESKFMVERMLGWADRAHGLRFAALRYFNAAGADPDGALGEDHRPETHLIPLAIDAALGRRPPLAVFGTDYPTPDGTCIRDYVHVSDLARAHLAAFDRLDHGSVSYNLGSETGHSVREVLASVARIAGRTVPHTVAERRAGDPAILVASSARIRAECGWQPRVTALDDIVATAWAWRVAHPAGYDG